MEYVCEVCGAAVYDFRGADETRCPDCEVPDEEAGGHAERRALRRLLRDAHEKGRGTPSDSAREDH